jgi:hypothetical protein
MSQLSVVDQEVHCARMTAHPGCHLANLGVRESREPSRSGPKATNLNLLADLDRHQIFASFQREIARIVVES